MALFHNGHWRSEYVYTGSDYGAYEAWVSGEISNGQFDRMTADGDGTDALRLPDGHVEGGHSYTKYEKGGPAPDSKHLEDGSRTDPEDWVVRTHRDADGSDDATSSTSDSSGSSSSGPPTRTLTWQANDMQRGMWAPLDSLTDSQRAVVIDSAVEAAGGTVSHFGGPKSWMLDNQRYDEASVEHTGNGRFEVVLRDTLSDSPDEYLDVVDGTTSTDSDNTADVSGPSDEEDDETAADSPVQPGGSTQPDNSSDDEEESSSTGGGNPLDPPADDSGSESSMPSVENLDRRQMALAALVGGVAIMGVR